MVTFSMVDYVNEIQANYKQPLECLLFWIELSYRAEFCECYLVSLGMYEACVREGAW